MIQIWVEAEGIRPGGRPILVRAPEGAVRTDLCEIRDAHGTLIATIRYSEHRRPDRRTRVWIDVEETAEVTVNGQAGSATLGPQRSGGADWSRHEGSDG